MLRKSTAMVLCSWGTGGVQDQMPWETRTYKPKDYSCFSILIGRMCPCPADIEEPVDLPIKEEKQATSIHDSAVPSCQLIIRFPLVRPL